jgi:lanthionine synthetase-like protein
VSGRGRRTAGDGMWLYLFAARARELPAHGWKLHVSARAEDLPQVMDLVVPVLLRYACDAKFARSTTVLAAMNRGEQAPALVGKAVTVYPRPQDVTVLGRELAAVLAGRPGPRVLSDRRIRPGAPVFYRYGPFRAAGTDDASLAMTGPDGSRFPGRAGTRYRRPPWAADPFEEDDRRQGARTAPLIGGRYRLTAGIARSPHGDVYRALDVRTGDRVVVKQARAYVGEDDDGLDARGRLRHEHAVLAALSGLDGVPHVVDHLRHGQDEYLVTTDCGPTDLRRDILTHGPCTPAPPAAHRNPGPAPAPPAADPAPAPAAAHPGPLPAGTGADRGTGPSLAAAAGLTPGAVPARSGAGPSTDPAPAPTASSPVPVNPADPSHGALVPAATSGLSPTPSVPGPLPARTGAVRGTGPLPAAAAGLGPGPEPAGAGGARGAAPASASTAPTSVPAGPGAGSGPEPSPVTPADPGPGAAGPVPGRDVLVLARRLLGLLGRVHARQVVMGDLKPANVVLGADGTVHLVDFGAAALRGERPAGATPGYSMPVYRAGGRPVPADDLYALGATLHFALTGMDPVVVDRGRAVNRDRTLACLAAARPGPADRQARELVAGLLDFDAAARENCARRFLAGTAPPRRRLPAPPRITPALLDELIAHGVETLVRAAAAWPADADADGPPGSGLTLYAGAAGVGLELLHHLDRPGAGEAVAALARRTAHDPALAGLGGAFWAGRTGVDLFLDCAGALPGAPALPPPPARLGPLDDSGDQIGGAAGAGTGLLVLARRASAAGREQHARAYLAAARDCLRRLPAVPAGGGPAGPPRSAASSEAAFAFGFAHGSAGVVHFLHAYHRLTADPGAAAAADRGLAELLDRTPRLLALAARPEAHRRHGSWCRGLAGIGAVLVGTGHERGDRQTVELGVRCARACHALAPRMSLVTQCCGLSGVGELLVDAAAVTGETGLWHAAEEVAALVLARSGGTPRRPLFPDNTLSASSPAWATGSAGVLSFLRRLRARGGPRPWTPAP